ncbi:MAG: O-antigen ligase family protein [Phycisphaerae bacterium]|nr:O-antigen ligase family protein [Phycisphaerae bacterium]
MYAINAPMDLNINPVEEAKQPFSPGWAMFIAIWIVCLLAGAALTLQMKQPVLGAIVAGLPTLAGILISPIFSLCCICLVLPLSGSINFEGVFTADRAIGALATAGILIHCKFFRGSVRISGSPLLPLFLIAGWSTLSALWSVNPQYAFFSALSLVQLSFWVWALWNAIAYRGNYIWPLRCYAAGMLVVVMRLYLSGGLSRIKDEGNAARLTLESTSRDNVNPNDFAAFLVPAFFIAVYLFLRDPAKFLRIIWVICAMVFPIMIVLTGARSALAGLLCALLVTALTFHHFIRARGALIGIVIAGICMVGGIFYVLSSDLSRSDAVQRILDPRLRGKGMNNRLMLMERGLTHIFSRPLLGTGCHNYVLTYQEKWAIHNDPMLIAAELGIFGGFLYFWFFWKLGKTVFGTRAPPEKWFARSLVIFLFVTGLAHPIFAAKSFWFFSVCGAAVAFRARQSEENAAMDLAYQYASMPPPDLQLSQHRWGHSYA